MQNKVQFTLITVNELEQIFKKVISEELTLFYNSKLPNDTPNLPELLTRNEAKELLKLSYPSLWRLNKLGILKSRKMGRNVYYYKEDIYNHLNFNGEI